MRKDNESDLTSHDHMDTIHPDDVTVHSLKGPAQISDVFQTGIITERLGEENGPSQLLGKGAPPFSAKTLDGNEVSLTNYEGKVVLVNFWATWCGNCKVEMPWLAQLREKYRSEGFEVLGIVTDGASPEKVAALAEKYGVHYPILACNHATAQAYGGLPDLPESFFIDRHGKIVAVMDGADSKEEIEVNIQKALRR